MSPLLAAPAAALVAFLAWRLRALTGSGAAAALLIGATVLWGAGVTGGLVLLAFFAPTSAVSRLTERRTPVWTGARGNQRDAVQVAANGWAAAAGGLVALVAPEPGLWIVTGALAAAAADTWATSVGALSRRDPVLIHSGVPVRKGTSGGVSLIGTIGGAGGAAVVAMTALLATRDPALAGAGLAAGVLGMVADSLLGATLQGRHRCPVCDELTERRRHRCGAATRRVGGVAWLSNDAVNGVATAVGAGSALAVWCWG